MICNECKKEIDDMSTAYESNHKYYCFSCFSKTRLLGLPPKKNETKDFIKADKGKLQWSLMPFEQLEQVVKVLEMGAEKYCIDNWKNCDDPKRYKDALMRHVISYIKGDKKDSESELSHLAHAICNCLFLMYFDDKENK